MQQQKLMEMDVETYPNLPPVASKPYTLPHKHQECIRKELEDLEKWVLFKEVFLNMLLQLSQYLENVHWFHQYKKQKDYVWTIESWMHNCLLFLEVNLPEQ